MLQYAKTLLDLYLPEKAEGQGMVEYALIIVLVSIAAIVALRALGVSINGVFNQINAVLGGSGGGS